MNEAANDEKLLTVTEMARYLSIGEMTLYSWMRQGKIPYIKIGNRSARFRAADISIWLDSKLKEKSKQTVRSDSFNTIK